MTGTYELAAQEGEFGYFVVVTVQVQFEDASPGLVIDFADDIASWRAGAAFGIAYAYERLPSNAAPSRRVRVHVRTLDGHVVDTTEVLAAYAAARAFWDAMDHSPSDSPVIDFGAGKVTFPK